MLNVYHSNRLEALFELMNSFRQDNPLDDPLTPETVLVANQGIGRWLDFKIADRAGIVANINYVLPATYVWQLYRSCLENVPERSAFDRSALRLRVLSQLDSVNKQSDDIWLPLQRYIATDSGTIGDTKRVQLASRIADVFDQYLVYRPKMLLDWEQGSNTIPGGDNTQRWQPALWRQLVESTKEPHRAALWKQFCTLADSGKIDPALLPKTLHLFNVGLLPPSTLDVLVQLAKIGGNEAGRVSLYFLNPAIDYWGDLLSVRAAARQRLKLSDGVELLADDQIGNPLLSSLGSSGQTFVKLLAERSEWTDEEAFFLPSANDSLLAAVQADLLQPYETAQQSSDINPSVEEIAGDQSIQFHQCYSPMREVQALHDRLLDRFNADDKLKPADVVVMMPDINRYAPVIEAVFGSVGGEPDSKSRMRQIPWSIADRALVEVSQVVACVQRLFELPGFEFEATAVMEFASEPAIARQFGFDERALNTLSEWLRDSGVRRTLAGQSEDGSVHEILSKPEAALHSWDFGLRRLLLGRAMPAGSDAVGKTLPSVQVDGQQAELLSQLLKLLKELEITCTELTKSRTPSEWVGTINGMITRLMDPDKDEADALTQFREMLNELNTDAESAGQTEPMTHATFAELLRGALAGAQRKNHRYLTGRVTFSSMVPLRSVPFRIVCMLGLNDSDFPRQKPNPGFDLMAQDKQLGDRSVRDDDRYLFLEALLSARDELYLSWVYRNLSDNAPREPSVLVSELRDYLEKRHPDQPARNVLHPLQPFSPTLFNTERPDLHTFADEWAPPAEKPAMVKLTETGTTPTPDASISIEDFQSFWRNPSKWYCRRVLGLSLWWDEQEPEDAEPFEVNALSRYFIRDNLIDELLQQPELQKEDAYNLQKQKGALPHGGLGELVFTSVFDEAKQFVQKLWENPAAAIPAMDIDVSVDGQQLQGRLTHGVKWTGGSIGLRHYHASNLNGSHIGRLWLAHLIGTAAGVLTGNSLLLTNDKERVLDAIDQKDALNKLIPWFDGWNIGQHSALPFFAKTSAVLAGAVVTGKVKSKARSVWLPSFKRPGESEEEAVQLLYTKPHEMLENEEVVGWANRLLGDEELKP